ncbi:hypothetical protein DPSP01_013055 [Paraphaeosphaeria sporulosa]
MRLCERDGWEMKPAPAPPRGVSWIVSHEMNQLRNATRTPSGSRIYIYTAVAKDMSMEGVNLVAACSACVFGSGTERGMNAQEMAFEDVGHSDETSATSKAIGSWRR